MMTIEERGPITWLNCWWEKANNPDVKRWILIGDSVARQYRSQLQKEIGKDIVIDYFGNAFHIEDGRFENQLRDFFEGGMDYRYELALVTWGGHHGLNKSIINGGEIRNIRNII